MANSLAAPPQDTESAAPPSRRSGPGERALRQDGEGARVGPGEGPARAGRPKGPGSGPAAGAPVQDGEGALVRTAKGPGSGRRRGRDQDGEGARTGRRRDREAPWAPGRRDRARGGSRRSARAARLRRRARFARAARRHDEGRARRRGEPVVAGALDALRLWIGPGGLRLFVLAEEGVVGPRRNRRRAAGRLELLARGRGTPAADQREDAEDGRAPEREHEDHAAMASTLAGPRTCVVACGAPRPVTWRRLRPAPAAARPWSRGSRAGRRSAALASLAAPARSGAWASISMIGSGSPLLLVSTLVVRTKARGPGLGDADAGSVAASVTPTSLSGGQARARAIAVLTTPSTIRLASSVARTPRVSEPLGATSTTCELGVSTRMLVVCDADRVLAALQRDGSWKMTAMRRRAARRR